MNFEHYYDVFMEVSACFGSLVGTLLRVDDLSANDDSVEDIGLVYLGLDLLYLGLLSFGEVCLIDWDAEQLLIFSFLLN